MGRFTWILTVMTNDAKLLGSVYGYSYIRHLDSQVSFVYRKLSRLPFNRSVERALSLFNPLGIKAVLFDGSFITHPVQSWWIMIKVAVELPPSPVHPTYLVSTEQELLLSTFTHWQVLIPWQLLASRVYTNKIQD